MTQRRSILAALVAVPAVFVAGCATDYYGHGYGYNRYGYSSGYGYSHYGYGYSSPYRSYGYGYPYRSYGYGYPSVYVYRYGYPYGYGPYGSYGGYYGRPYYGWSSVGRYHQRGRPRGHYDYRQYGH